MSRIKRTWCFRACSQIVTMVSPCKQESNFNLIIQKLICKVNTMVHQTGRLLQPDPLPEFHCQPIKGQQTFISLVHYFTPRPVERRSFRLSRADIKNCSTSPCSRALLTASRFSRPAPVRVTSVKGISFAEGIQRFLFLKDML